MQPVAPPLLRYLTLSYGLLLVYACLYPLTGWQEAAGVLDYLKSLPRYWRWGEATANVLGFVPLGFLLVANLSLRWPPLLAVGLALLGGVLFSFSMETLQNFLPTRVPSLLDWLTNSLGTLLGALAGLRWGWWFTRRGGLEHWRHRHILAGTRGDVGLILLAVWLFAQLSTQGLLFAMGDLRELLDLPPPLGFSVPRYIRLEAALVATQVFAFGLWVRALLRYPSAWEQVWMLVLVFATGLAVHSVATVMLEAQPWSAWATPGAQLGLFIGVAGLIVALWLPLLLQRMVAGLALLLATVLTNLAPQNPFSDTLLEAGGGFLHFNGLTAVAADAWPFLALLWLAWIQAPASSRRES